MKMDLLPCNSEKLLVNFPPSLRQNFKELFCNGKIGLSSFAFTDITSTKQYTENNSTYSYNYTLRIPYAGKRLLWELIFDPEDMSFAPDFNFNDDNFYMSNDIDLIIENIPTLANWNINNPKSLTLVLKELVNLYKKQQLQKLQQDNIYSQLNSEYQVLIEEYSVNDVEVYLDSTCAHFLINIKVDTTSLPEYLQPMKNGHLDDLLNPGDDTCILKVLFLKLDGSRNNTSLQLSPRLDQVLGNARSLHIPIYSKATSLADYVHLIVKMLQDHIKKVEELHKLKKEFIMCMCAMYAGNIVEFDSDTFYKINLLCELNGYYCLVCIELGDLFPEEKPVITLHSLYCMSHKKACTEQVTKYLYSPRWSPENMIRKLMTSLTEIMQKFKNHKH